MGNVLRQRERERLCVCACECVCVFCGRLAECIRTLRERERGESESVRKTGDERKKGQHVSIINQLPLTISISLFIFFFCFILGNKILLRKYPEGK